MSVTFKHGVKHIDFDVVSKWLGEAYWSPGITKAEVILGARNSSLVVGGFDESGKQVSFLRVLSDQVRFAYILDVIVDPARRKQGIGIQLWSIRHETPGNVTGLSVVTPDQGRPWGVRPIGFWSSG